MYEFIKVSPYNIRKAIYTCFMISLSLSGFAQTKPENDQFTLSGKIIGQQEGYVALEYINREGESIKDTCELKTGKFYFEGNISEPTMAFLRGAVESSADSDPNATSFYLEPKSMTATAKYNHFKEIKITGSKTQTEFEVLQGKWSQASSAAEFSEIDHQFIAAHPDSYVSALTLLQNSSRWALDTVRLFYDKLNPAVQNSYYGKEVGESLIERSDNSPGQMAKNFTNLDIKGKRISLADFKGSYVLLDFWGSWCAPCRKANPHLIELFKKYHDQGLEIVGIASDTSPKAWRNAVEKDGVGLWHNILSGLQQNENWAEDRSQWISAKFGVFLYPTKILIDKSGKIIGRYDGGGKEAALDNKLIELFE